MVATFSETFFQSLIVFFVLAILFLWIYLAVTKQSLFEFIKGIREAVSDKTEVVYEQTIDKFSQIR